MILVHLFSLVFQLRFWWQLLLEHAETEQGWSDLLNFDSFSLWVLLINNHFFYLHLWVKCESHQVLNKRCKNSKLTFLNFFCKLCMIYCVNYSDIKSLLTNTKNIGTLFWLVLMREIAFQNNPGMFWKNTFNLLKYMICFDVVWYVKLFKMIYLINNKFFVGRKFKFKYSFLCYNLGI